MLAHSFELRVNHKAYHSQEKQTTCDAVKDKRFSQLIDIRAQIAGQIRSDADARQHKPHQPGGVAGRSQIRDGGPGNRYDAKLADNDDKFIQDHPSPPGIFQSREPGEKQKGNPCHNKSDTELRAQKGIEVPACPATPIRTKVSALKK